MTVRPSRYWSRRAQALDWNKELRKGLVLGLNDQKIIGDLNQLNAKLAEIGLGW